MPEPEKTAKEREKERRIRWELHIKPSIKLIALIVFVLWGGYFATCSIESAAKCLYVKNTLAEFTWQQVLVILGAMLAITVILVVSIHYAFRLFRDD